MIFIIAISTFVCIMLAGGLFLIYKSVKEVHEKLEGGEEHAKPAKASTAFAALVVQILVVDMVFSFDSIVTAIGQDNQVEALGDAFAGLPAQVLEGAAEARAVDLRIEERGELHRLEAAGTGSAV